MPGGLIRLSTCANVHVKWSKVVGWGGGGGGLTVVCMLIESKVSVLRV